MIKKRSDRTQTSVKAKKSNSDFSSIQDRIKPVSSLGLVIAALFYGRVGTGKTTIASTFPKPLLLLDIREKGTDSVSDVEDLDTIQINSWDDFEQVYWYLCRPENRYKTVVVDALTQLQDFAVEKAMADDGKEDGIVTKRQWGSASGKMKTWIINYRDLIDRGINVVFLAHDRTNEGEDGEDGEITPVVGPRLMPSVASIVNGSVKIMGNTFIREVNEKKSGSKRKVVYCMRIGPHAFYETKVRQPINSFTPDIIENPNYDIMVSLMKGEFKPEPEPVNHQASRKLLKKGS